MVLRVAKELTQPEHVHRRFCVRQKRKDHPHLGDLPVEAQTEIVCPGAAISIKNVKKVAKRLALIAHHIDP